MSHGDGYVIAMNAFNKMIAIHPIKDADEDFLSAETQEFLQDRIGEPTVYRKISGNLTADRISETISSLLKYTMADVMSMLG